MPHDEPSVRLSILDQSPIGEGRDAAQALRESRELARHADAWGYTRYWVAEHHHSAAFAGPAPEMLAAVLLESTQRMRIGTGGILLPRYTPGKVAEAMGVLARLYPGRVDIGIGRAGGPAPDFGQRFEALIRLLTAEDGPDHGEPPGDVWLLGAGGSSAPLAGRLGAGYAFGHFFSPDQGPQAMADYRGNLPAGRPGAAAVAVRAVVAEDAAHAAALARAMLLWRSRRDLGHDEPLPTPATAAAHVWSEDERMRAVVQRRTLVHGTPEQVREQLTGIAAAHGVGEVIVNTLTADVRDRLTSFRLLAEAFASPRDAGRGVHVAEGASTAAV